MRVSRSDGLRCDFSANNLTISMSYMSFCNFNSKSDRRRYNFFFNLNTALPFPLQNLVQRFRSRTPSSVSSTPNEVSAIPCVALLTLRVLFLKNRDFFCYGEIFLPNTRGPLGCLLGFWPSGPDGQNPAGAMIAKVRFVCEMENDNFTFNKHKWIDTFIKFKIWIRL